MRTARWHTSPLAYNKVRKLSETLGTSEVMATVLARRGYDTPESAHRFLSPLGELHSPFLFPRMKAICDRLRAAIASGEHICIHGDYDVDGISSTALLVEVFTELGGRVSHHLPNRFKEGYGIAAATVENIAARGASLLLTVDCGISARSVLGKARQLGMEVIVIDHHRPVEGELPEAEIISPLLCDYPFKELAGVGLAFKLAQGLIAAEAGDETGAGMSADELPPLLKRQLDLVALGTIADVVPLLGENRSLVKRGLVQMARSHRPGIRALMRIGKVDESRLSAGLVAFRLAPRINAAGRLDDPDPALKLLLAKEDAQAEELAAALNALNRERQQIENRMVAEAEEQIGRMTAEQREQRGYVLSSDKWHEGVIGIVASRMVELHHRPVIMVSEKDGHGKGSGRSIPAFDLHGSLVELSPMLASFGGHRAACGLTIELDRLPEFKQAFADYADAALTKDELHPSRYVDALVCGHELTLDLAQELAQLEPFGLGNPSVELLAAGAAIQDGRATRDGNHLQCRVEAGGARSTAIGFGQGYLAEKLNGSSRWDVAFRLEQNEWGGSISPQLNLREIFSRPLEPETPAGPCRGRCDYDCPDRVTGDEFWSLVSSGAPLPTGWEDSGVAPAGIHSHDSLDDRLVDRRGYGSIPGQTGRLMTTGQSILLLVADVARRRRQLVEELPAAASGVRQVLLASSRCGRETIMKRMEKAREGRPVLMVADFATATATPELTALFDHLVFVDPPYNQGVFDAIAGGAPQAFVHLFHCANEVQFTRKVLEHEYDLRTPLAKLYRHLKAEKSYPLDNATERLLLAGGKYLRQPALVARCLQVLKELALIAVEDGAEGPILTLPAAERTELEQSPTFNRVQSFYRECLQYLSKSPNVII